MRASLFLGRLYAAVAIFTKAALHMSGFCDISYAFIHAPKVEHSLRPSRQTGACIQDIMMESGCGLDLLH